MLSLSKLLFKLAQRRMGSALLHRTAALARRKELTSQLLPTLGSKVLDGPFAGMTLPVNSSWRDGDLVPKLIGSYESDLRQAIERAIKRHPHTVINVGCAEGYYAIGLARALPQSTVYAFDLDPDACSICSRAARENGVADRVIVGGRCEIEHLSKVLAVRGRTLLVMDCEGAERDLLDPVKLSGLIKCDIIVETHGANIASDLVARFSPSHEVERIVQGGRDPNVVPDLRRLAEPDRWLLVDEGRPESMSWLALWGPPSSVTGR